MGPGKESWFSLLLLLLFWRRGSRPLSLTRTHSHTRKKGNGGISRMGAAAAGGGGGGGRACLPFMTGLSRGEEEYHIFRTLPPSSPCPVRGKGREKGTSPPPAARRPPVHFEFTQCPHGNGAASAAPPTLSSSPRTEERGPFFSSSLSPYVTGVHFPLSPRPRAGFKMGQSSTEERRDDPPFPPLPPSLPPA